MPDTGKTRRTELTPFVYDETHANRQKQQRSISNRRARCVESRDAYETQKRPRKTETRHAMQTRTCEKKEGKQETRR